LLDRAGVTLAPLISIIVAWALSAALGMDQEASSTAARAFPTLPKVQFDVILNVNNLGMFITLFVLDFYGSVAKFVGLLLHTNILKDGRVPNRTRALLIDGAGTAAGAVLGTTSVIAYVESAVAIKMGARTGLASVTCALLLGLGGLLGSDVARIPLISTSGTIVFVGLKLLPDRGSRTNMLVVDYIAMIAMSLTMIATLALERALLVGFMTYVCWEWVHGRTGNIFMAVSAVVLALSYFLR
jgi:AGZA family xanthine/uracil permease-like MFS transporter